MKTSNLYLIQRESPDRPGIWDDVGATMLWHKAIGMMHDLSLGAVDGEALRVVMHRMKRGSDSLGEYQVVGYCKATYSAADYGGHNDVQL